MDMISLANTYLKSARPSMLKKQKVENVFDAMKTISNQISYNNRKKTKKKGQKYNLTVRSIYDILGVSRDLINKTKGAIYV